MLREGSDSDRVQAAKKLGQMESPAKDRIPALKLALGDEYEAVRVQAAIGLGKMGPDAKTAVPLLKNALRDSTAEVRDAAKAALALVDSKSTTK